MPLRIDDIQAPIRTEMAAFEGKFREFMKSEVMLLDQIMNYIVKRKGKQIRPMFVFLMAKALGGVSEKTYRGAAFIEILHTATLVHDDVVDDSNYRRGFFSVNALWKNKIAVLVGDYLLGRGLMLSVENEDFAFLKIISQAVREISEGELLQMEKARRLDITEDVYFDIIRRKTATLIAACCAVGATASETTPDTIARAHRFGEKVGIAFQIKDDLFDYGDAEIGKPVGIDIKEKKMTLPLIYALSKSSWLQKRKIINLIKNHSEESQAVREVIDFVKNSGGIAYATARMKEYVAEAEAILISFPPSEYRNSLSDLVKFTIERTK